MNIRIARGCHYELLLNQSVRFTRTQLHEFMLLCSADIPANSTVDVSMCGALLVPEIIPVSITGNTDHRSGLYRRAVELDLHIWTYTEYLDVMFGGMNEPVYAQLIAFGVASTLENIRSGNLRCMQIPVAGILTISPPFRAPDGSASMPALPLTAGVRGTTTERYANSNPPLQQRYGSPQNAGNLLADLDRFYVERTLAELRSETVTAARPLMFGEIMDDDELERLAERNAQRAARERERRKRAKQAKEKVCGDLTVDKLGRFNWDA